MLMLQDVENRRAIGCQVVGPAVLAPARTLHRVLDARQLEYESGDRAVQPVLEVEARRRVLEQVLREPDQLQRTVVDLARRSDRRCAYDDERRRRVLVHLWVVRARS